MNTVIGWELFRSRLQTIRENTGTGCKAFDEVLMFKANDVVEYLIWDRISDAKTTWLFRKQLTKTELIKPLFNESDGCLQTHDHAQNGHIVDATMVPVPIQRNRPKENEQRKAGQTNRGRKSKRIRIPALRGKETAAITAVRITPMSGTKLSESQTPGKAGGLIS